MAASKVSSSLVPRPSIQSKGLGTRLGEEIIVTSHTELFVIITHSQKRIHNKLSNLSGTFKIII